ncbi:calcium-binding protein [Gymnodinialimonas hymeniacidonis]|uniref:calcium-binding protein n=1 Tax=Gymnodinialimonas hymeniacidonis TaxID=3126508 RepID=UPI0034C5CCF0
MIGILGLLLLGVGISLMLPDGSEDGSSDFGGDVASDEPSVETDASAVSPDQTELLDLLPSGSRDVAIDDTCVDFISGPEAAEVVVADESEADNNRTGASNAPYENDFDLDAFESVEFAQDTDNEIIGTSGSDLLVGGGVSDTVVGCSGDDYLYGGEGSDTILGGDGNDLIVAVSNPYLEDEAPASELYGGDGDDTLIGENDDLLVGGNGTDFFYIFSDDGATPKTARVSDFDASAESLLIEMRDDQTGGELHLDVRPVEHGVEVVVNGVPVVLLEGVSQTAELDIRVASVA